MRIVQDLPSRASFTSLNVTSNLMIPTASVPQTHGSIAYVDGKFAVSSADGSTVKIGQVKNFTTDKSASIPSTKVFVTACAGGGCGGASSSMSGVYIAGGGGGAGESCSGIPVDLSTTSDSMWCVDVKIGKGGTPQNPDGTDTILTFTGDDTNTIIILVCKGGKGAASSVGGSGGTGNFHPSFAGISGTNGATVYGSQSSQAIGGKAGVSFLYDYGCGGTGMTYGKPSTRTNGQNGFASIRF